MHSTLFRGSADSGKRMAWYKYHDFNRTHLNAQSTKRKNVNRSGRSSDYLPFRITFPISLETSGPRSRSRNVTEVHSSGTVRDFHPIPFSSSLQPTRKKRHQTGANIKKNLWSIYVSQDTEQTNKNLNTNICNNHSPYFL